MPCTRPLTAWRGPVGPNGKRPVVFKPGESTPGLVAFPQRLPCGACPGCLHDRAADWAVRCQNESQMHSSNSFVTLTYSEDKLPLNRALDKRVWQLFVKKLRKRFGKFRYFMAGEYGERFKRPHYHAALFGVDFSDKEFLKKSPAGMPLFTSKLLSEVWGNGYASVGSLTKESCAYVARYTTKKHGKAFAPVDTKTGEVMQSEFILMSRRPGIGRSWFEKFGSDVYPHGYMIGRGGFKIPPSRYYDGLYEVENPLDMARIKCDRMSRSCLIEDVWNDKLRKWQRLDVNRSDRLAVREEVMVAKYSALKRELESGLQ